MMWAITGPAVESMYLGTNGSLMLLALLAVTRINRMSMLYGVSMVPTLDLVTV